jgi:uncharacterized membrane protein
MDTIEQSVEVDAPVHTAYNQWTQFEEFPEFMEGVEEVRQLDDKRLHWVAEIAGKRHEWDAEIVEQVPDQRIAWRATSGKRNEGTVTFEKVRDDKTRVTVRIVWEPEGTLEKLADVAGLASARVKGDLKRFKEFIESRRQETGAWRGEIRGNEVSRADQFQPRSKRLQDIPGVTTPGTPSTTPGGASGKM